MDDVPKDELELEFQTIPHRASDSLNQFLKQDYVSSLDFILDELPDDFDFITKESDNIEIRQAHARFLDYLRHRMGVAANLN